ncbi:uncharacterized protein LOC123218612 isoform X1 [Mangifera indica]|uniref:uncharacterized protein LOC123218612 isoform X1 n=1 Tax=Mangifera indica TaxID=29780 RepID=UPI001CFA6450|nr:uncharacterized protein LOC123218612 isoform X1 [Mangifera indica]
MFIVDLPPILGEEIMKDNSTSASTSTEKEIEIVIGCTEIETRNRHLNLYHAAFRGDWYTAERIFKENENDITAKLSNEGDTALHIAAEARRTTFVEKLVEKMQKDDLSVKNNAGNTAFFLAASSNKVAIVKAMMKKNEELIKKKGEKDMLPLVMAAMMGNKEMIEYLYEATGEELLDDSNRIELLVNLINHGLYDIALDLVERDPKKAIARDKNQLTALHHLAKMPVQKYIFDFDGIRVGGRLLIRLCNEVKREVKKRRNSALRRQRVQDTNKLGLKDRINEREQRWRDRMGLEYRTDEAICEVNFASEKTLPFAFELVKCLWKQVIQLNDSEISEIIREPWPLMFEAAKQGNVVFLRIIWQTNPDMMFEVDENNYSVFHLAVIHRCHRIFSFIHHMGPLKKDLIVQKTDKEGNNILHLAAKLPSQDRPVIELGGPAHQMWLELVWFKNVKTMLRPVDAEARNKEGKTARALFTEEHKELRKKAEKWTKEIANACIVAATLIATVAFTAALTVPGGTNEGTGTPHFVQRASFIIFAVSDTAALLFSSLSIVRLISVFSYPYEDTDFNSRLFPDLNSGLALLFYSVEFMMAGFCANMFIVFKDGMPWIPILITVMAAFTSFIIWNKFTIAIGDCVRFSAGKEAFEIALSQLDI